MTDREDHMLQDFYILYLKKEERFLYTLFIKNTECMGIYFIHGVHLRGKEMALC